MTMVGVGKVQNGIAMYIGADGKGYRKPVIVQAPKLKEVPVHLHNVPQPTIPEFVHSRKHRYTMPEPVQAKPATVIQFPRAVSHKKRKSYNPINILLDYFFPEAKPSN